MAGQGASGGLQIGRDVPWVTAWSSELEAREQGRYCEHAGAMALWRPETPGVGQARFKALHEVRQRRAVKQLLCQVCGRRTPSHDRWLFAKGGWRPDPDDGGWIWCTDDAPVHRACGALVRARCPFVRGEGIGMVRFPAVHAVRLAASPATGLALTLLIVAPPEFAVRAFGPPPG